MAQLKKKALSIILIFSLFVGIVGVVNADTTYAATKKIHLRKTTIIVNVGKSFQQKMIDKNGKTIKATKVKWKSLKPSVAKISKSGKIKTLKRGTVKMTATYKGKTYKFTVKVKRKDQNTSISFKQKTLTVQKGEKKRIIVKTDNGEDIEYIQSNDNVECEWGDWLSNGIDSYFYIEGVNSGTSVVTVRDSKDKSIKASINVNIVDENMDEATGEDTSGNTASTNYVALKMNVPQLNTMNYYVEFEIYNKSNEAIFLSRVGGAGLKVVTAYFDTMIIQPGEAYKISYYTSVIPSERWDDKYKNMYLDQTSTGYIYISNATDTSGRFKIEAKGDGTIAKYNIPW